MSDPTRTGILQELATEPSACIATSRRPTRARPRSRLVRDLQASRAARGQLGSAQILIAAALTQAAAATTPRSAPLARPRPRAVAWWGHARIQALIQFRQRPAFQPAPANPQRRERLLGPACRRGTARRSAAPAPLSVGRPREPRSVRPPARPAQRGAARAARASGPVVLEQLEKPPKAVQLDLEVTRQERVAAAAARRAPVLARSRPRGAPRSLAAAAADCGPAPAPSPARTGASAWQCTPGRGGRSLQLQEACGVAAVPAARLACPAAAWLR